MSNISWTDYSFVAWFGCSKVSDGCDNCYAEDWTVRRFHKAGWGPHADRIPAALSAWSQPYAWNRRVERGDPRRFVFAFQMADVFDKKAPADSRERLWQTIQQTPNLVWLILSKRPQNFRRMLPADWGDGYPNVWLGVTAENQRETNRRLPILCRTPAVRRFVSAEPLLEAIDLRPWLGAVSWVIGGCESDPRSRYRPKRPCDPDWLRAVRDQCQDAGVPFWLKQMVVGSRIVEVPELDGRTWTERPPARFRRRLGRMSK